MAWVRCCCQEHCSEAKPVLLHWEADCLLSASKRAGLSEKKVAFLLKTVSLLRIRHKLLLIFIYQLEITRPAAAGDRVLLTDNR